MQNEVVKMQKSRTRSLWNISQAPIRRNYFQNDEDAITEMQKLQNYPGNLLK